MSDTGKPTPGPRWIVGHDTEPGMEWNMHIVEANNLDNRICFMAHSGAADNSVFEGYASLIASAPDLAEENRRLREALERERKRIQREQTEWHRFWTEQANAREG